MHPSQLPAIVAPQQLIFDADDTLWENNIYFERAFIAFAELLSETGLTTSEIQTVLDEHELANRSLHGYGARAYTRSLVHTYIQITGCQPSDHALKEVEKLGLQILGQKMEEIDGVADTLTALSRHHEIYLLTKGDEEEQQAKVAHSGLQHLFKEVVITSEKSVRTYHEFVENFGLEIERSWMIGNSPRSDINPALTAGLNAIYVPHDRTWHLEAEALPINPAGPGRLLQLSRFRDLTTVFTVD